MYFEIITFIRLLVRRTYVTLSEVMSSTGSSQRQILYRLEKVNIILIDEDVEPIYIGENKEFIISNETRAQLIDLLYIGREMDEYYMNRDERIFTLFLMLFIHNEYLSLNHFIHHLKVSKSTVLQDFKELQLNLSTYNITVKNDRLNGYYLQGEELDIRHYLMNNILKSVSKEKNTNALDMFLKSYKLESFDYMKLIVQELSLIFQIVFVEDRLAEFIYIFILLKARVDLTNIPLSNNDNFPHVEVISTFNEYDFTKKLCDYFKIDSFDEKDLQYLTSWIVGISVADVESMDEDCVFISEIVGKILSRFEMISGMHYSNVEDIFRHVYSHMRPAYYRLLFKHPIHNPLAEAIYTNYHELYSVVNEVMKPFNNIFGQSIPQEEIAYLTLHFSSLYTDLQHRKSNKIQALVICTNGVGSSVLLYNELRNLFPEINFYKPIDSLSFTTFDEYYDVIFTTQYFDGFNDLKVPIIKVNAVMSLEEKYQLDQEVKLQLGFLGSSPLKIVKIKELVSKYYGPISDEEEFVKELISIIHPQSLSKMQFNNYNEPELKLIDLLDISTIHLGMSFTSDIEALDYAGSVMVENGYISENYKETVIRQYSNETTHLVIAPQIVLPHTSPFHGVYRPGIGITTFKNSLAFKSSEEGVKVMFYLCPPSDYSHIAAMSELLELLSDERFVEKLTDFESPQELLNSVLTRFQ